MDEQSKIEGYIILTIGCSDELAADVSFSPNAVRFIFGAKLHRAHFTLEALGDWWMAPDDEVSLAFSKSIGLAGLSQKARDWNLSYEQWNNDVTHVVLGPKLEVSTRTVRDLWVWLFPNAKFAEEYNKGGVGPELWGPNFRYSDVSPEEAARSILIEEFELDVRFYNKLKKAGIVTAGDLASMSSAKLQELPRVGPWMVQQAIDALATVGLQLAPDE